MNHGQCCGIEDIFDPTTARKDLKRYRKRGPNATTRILIDALRPEVTATTTVLDIGGGVGAIQHELLRAGAARAIDVDASAAYLAAAREEAERQGHAEQVEQLEGDFVELAPQIPPADIVTLDRVVCCYPDARTLVELSSARAERWYGLSFPRETWWVRMGVAISNLFFRLRGNPFRVFVHPGALVDAVTRANGLERRFVRKTWLWQVRVYAR